MKLTVTVGTPEKTQTKNCINCQEDQKRDPHSKLQLGWNQSHGDDSHKNKDGCRPDDLFFSMQGHKHPSLIQSYQKIPSLPRVVDSKTGLWYHL